MDNNDEGVLSACTRRRVLAALPGLVVLPGVAAAACSSANKDSAEDPTAQRTTSVPETSIDTGQIPVGSAKVFSVGSSGQGVVVAQPKAGEFVAYSATCTHQGGRVQVVSGTKLRCPLHGAEYQADTGKVTNPPAKRPLDKVDFTLDGTKLTLS